VPEFILWQEIVDKCINNVIHMLIVLPAKLMGLQYMMISKIQSV
jgi:hypothetical protein